MFDKEAEEWVKTKGTDAITCLKENIGWDDVCEQAFKDAANFGYNKANEWHKQDIDDIYDLISKDWNFKHFICIMKDKRRLTATGCCDEDLNGGVSAYLDFDHDDDKYYIDDIVWWKEIILPKGDA